METNSIEILVHIPQVWLQPWKELEPHPAQKQFLQMSTHMPIGIWLPTPAILESNSSKQTEILGKACLATVEKLKPRFHKCLLNGKLVETSGTTIMVTGYDSTKSHVIFGTWDIGEDFGQVLTRLAEARRICKLPAVVADALLHRGRTRFLPSPQLVLSNVIGAGIKRPMTTLGGYDEDMAPVPMTIAVGQEEMHLVFDHRLYTPQDEMAFANVFMEQLNA